MNYVCPLIVVQDIEIAKKFYEKVLGQKVKYDFGENVTFKGEFSIHQEEHFENLVGLKENKVIKKSNNFELYFETEDIERVFEELKEAEVEFLHEIREQPWGQRVMRFYDPDFHIIEVGESMETVVLRCFKMGMSIEEICKKSSMPEEFVQRTITLSAMI